MSVLDPALTQLVQFDLGNNPADSSGEFTIPFRPPSGAGHLRYVFVMPVYDDTGGAAVNHTFSTRLVHIANSAIPANRHFRLRVSRVPQISDGLSLGAGWDYNLKVKLLLIYDPPELEKTQTTS